jgi:hypothetical protein
MTLGPPQAADALRLTLTIETEGADPPSAGAL